MQLSWFYLHLQKFCCVFPLSSSSSISWHASIVPLLHVYYLHCLFPPLRRPVSFYRGKKAGKHFVRRKIWLLEDFFLPSHPLLLKFVILFFSCSRMSIKIYRVTPFWRHESRKKTTRAFHFIISVCCGHPGTLAAQLAELTKPPCKP